MSRWVFYQESIRAGKRIQDIFISDYSNDILYMVRDYYDISRGTFKGIIVLGINTQKLLESYEALKKYDDALGLIYGRDGRILAATHSDFIGRNIQTARYQGTAIALIPPDTSRYILRTTELPFMDVHATVILPTRVIMAELQTMLSEFIPVLIILLVLLLLTTALISRRLNAYISSLIHKLDDIRHENYATALPSYGIVEIDSLGRTINDMSREIDYLIHTVYENRLLLKEAELKALQVQINPHFLFNVLLVISWKARTNGDAEVHDMIDALSGLLSATISQEPESFKTTIGQELETARFYLYLQSKRFGDAMRYTITVDDPGLTALYIPRLSIQTLVENAVVHGLEPKKDKGHVLIHVRSTSSGKVLISVTDDGVGFDTSAPAASRSSHHTVGLRNTRRRIAALYGEGYTLEITSSPGAGTTVTMVLPVDREPSLHPYSVALPWETPEGATI